MERGQFISACRQGAAAMEQAARVLQRDYWGALMREGLQMLGDRDRALDAVQGTLIRAWHSCASFRGESELFPWLKQILRNLAVDELRRRETESIDDEAGQTRPEVEAALARDGRGALPLPDEAMFDHELEQIYRRCAADFAAAHPLAANVIRWVAEDDLDLPEIAQLLGRTPGATREFVSQCRKKARLAFAPWHDALRARSTA